MKKAMDIRAMLLALFLGFYSISAQAVFDAAMTRDQIRGEIVTMLAQNNPVTGHLYTLIEVASAAKLAGVTADEFTAAAIAAGLPLRDTVIAAITVWGEASAVNVVTAAVGAIGGPNAPPDQVAVITDAAISVAPNQTAAIMAAASTATGAGGTVGGPAGGNTGGNTGAVSGG